MKRTIFDIFHPVVQLLYFVALIAFTMFALHPLYAGVSLVAAVSYNGYLRGWRATARMLAWQLPLFLLVMILNALLSGAGSTLLFAVGPFSVYLEGAIFGACMGGMLVSMMLWFSNAAQVLSLDKVMGLFGDRAPTITLMMSMVARLMPKLVAQGEEIRIVQKANATSAPSSKREFVKEGARLSSVLMGWSMEDSLETSDAMRARGFSSSVKRSSYARHRFRMRDAIAVGCLVLAIVLNGCLLAVALLNFHFYPTIGGPVVGWGVVTYAILAFLPLAGQFADDLKWVR